MIQYKDILCEIKNIIDTKYYCYKMKPERNINGPWEQNGYSDADYEEDNDTRKSMTGYIVLINGAVIACHLKSQKT